MKSAVLYQMVDRETYHFVSLANEIVPPPCKEKTGNESMNRKGRGEVEEEDPVPVTLNVPGVLTIVRAFLH